MAVVEHPHSENRAKARGKAHTSNVDGPSSVNDATLASEHSPVDEVASAGKPFVNVAYFEPRIPGNTGSTIRLAAVTGARLHLIEPLGFDLSEAKLKRAGLDYHDLAVTQVHASFEAALTALPCARVFAFTTRASVCYSDVEYQPGDVLLFGPEPTGLPDEVLAHPRVTERLLIPMLPGRRSLNLANASAIAVYEAWRQQGFESAR